MASRFARSYDTSVWRPVAFALVSIIVSVAGLAVLLGVMTTQLSAAHIDRLADPSHAGMSTAPTAPIPPPEGYPKLKLSSKTVTPTLAATGGAVLTYVIEIGNTGATTATNTTLLDNLPDGVVYNGDGWASSGSPPVIVSRTLSWVGVVGFDSSVIVTFSVSVEPSFEGTLQNTATISDPHIAAPVTVSAETAVTDEPILSVEKASLPEKPGANKPLHYALSVTNWGQPALSLPITVTDRVPTDTTLRDVGPDGVANAAGTAITWTRPVTLELGQSALFTFSVDIGDVPSGTIISNEQYAVAGPSGTSVGEPYTITVADPILSLAKHVWPDPPGSNREITYTLTVFNGGSLATNLVITDRVPLGVSYVRGGVENAGVVSWYLADLDTGESAELTFTVEISDVMNVPILNEAYGVCSSEEVCASGAPLTSVVQGPVFEAYAMVDPIAHKPGGGTGTEVTPTLVVHNVGAGNSIDAQATLFFGRLSVSENDLYADPPIGSSFSDGPDCGDKCKSYVWVGSLAHGELVTFTTHEGQSTIGGEEGTHYTATVVITDVMANMTTFPVTGTTFGTVTHMANVQPIKTAPPAVGPGQLLTYTVQAINRGLTTELPPILTDVIPLSTTFKWASDGGVSVTVSDTGFVSWTLPLLSPGEGAVRTFAVLVDADLVSGTQIVNRDYSVTGYGNVLTATVTSGPPVTTTVREVGLIDSFKVATPQLAFPGPSNVITFEVHLVNSGPLDLRGVSAHDALPWEVATYRRDATADSGELISDIVSYDWNGDLAPFSQVVVTASVLVDVDFAGALTNTVVISHPTLSEAVERSAVVYVTDKPVLSVRKTALPDPVALGERLTYRLRVTNIGQQATGLIITDQLPSNVAYVPDSATSGGRMMDDVVQWTWPVLEPIDEIEVGFQVTVEQGMQVVNRLYGVNSAEGVFDLGREVVTPVKGGGLYLPVVFSRTP